MKKFIDIKKEETEGTEITEVKEEKNMLKTVGGFCKKHWKGLAAGAVGLLATVGVVAYNASKKDEDDEYIDDFDDAEEAAPTEDDSEE